MLGQTVFYTLTQDDKGVMGELPRQSYPAVITDVRGSTVVLSVLTGVWHRPVWVRQDVSAGGPGEPGTWNAVAP